MNDNNSSRILLVDDESNILSSLKRLLKKQGYDADTFTCAEDAIQQNLEQYDVIVSDMRMPGMDGAQFLEHAFDQSPETIRILLTGFSDLSTAVEAINRGHIYRYLTKPWDDHDFVTTINSAVQLKQLEAQKILLQEETQRKNEELTQLKETLEERVIQRTQELNEANQTLKDNYTNTIKTFSTIINLRIHHHEKEFYKYVTEYSRRLATWMKLTDQEVQDVTFASLLKDIGKVSLPDRLIHTAPAAMRKEDRNEYFRHPAIGATVLSSLPPLQAAANILADQLEMYNGEGLHKKAGQDISTGARIIAIANDYVLLRTGGADHKVHNKKEACDYLRRNEYRRYDPDLVYSFISMLLREHDDPLLRSAGRKVGSNKLNPGMRLGEDLQTKGGVRLFKKGTILNSDEIQKIRDFEKQNYYLLPIIIE